VNELIFLVNDEPSIVHLARMYLERAGFQIESANDGESALDKVTGQLPALVVGVMLPNWMDSKSATVCVRRKS